MELMQVLALLRSARTPEEVFGTVGGDAGTRTRGVKDVYRGLVRVVHTDVNPHDVASAHEAMVLLNRWLEEALARVKGGRYGTCDAGADVTLTSRRRAYRVMGAMAAGDLCDLYRATYVEDGLTHRCIAKVVRASCDMPALGREALVLRTLHRAADGTSFGRYFLPVLDSFTISDGATLKRVLVLPEITDGFTLEQIRARYLGGVDPRHMVWMWKRLLAALGFAHRQGIVHGGVIPPHLLVRPADHGAYLIDWTGASADGAASYVSTAYADWYPREVRARRALPATDLYMAAKCAIYLLGGDPVAESLPAHVPGRLATFIKSCLLPAPERRPSDAWQLHAEFDETVVRPLFGPPAFLPFAMA